MRIIAGELRGRQIQVPKGSRIRPATGAVRETVMNLFGPERIRGGPFLDLCAGTGLVGLEALSRGAPRAIFVEADGATAARLSATLHRWDLDSRCTVLKVDARRCFRSVGRQLGDERASSVFLDPPYIAGLAREILTRLGGHAALMHPQGLLIVRTPEELPEEAGELRLAGQRACGNARLWIYASAGTAPDEAAGETNPPT